MGFRPHYFLDLMIAGLACSAAGLLGWWALNLPRRVRRATWAALAVAVVLILVMALFGTVRVSRQFPPVLVAWVRCLGLFAAVSLGYICVLTAIFRRAHLFNPERRRALKLAATAAAAVPAGLAAFAIAKRDDLQFREVELRIPLLPRDLDGLRLVQLTDIHLGAFVSETLLRRAIGMANEIGADVALVTGDLITSRGDPLAACLRNLADLRAAAGIFGCCGNHEIYAGAEDDAEREGRRLGIRFLRNEAVRLRFGDALLNLAGVDYQRESQHFLRGAETLVIPGVTNVLLSHNPNVFPVAAKQGFDLTIAGHTHGGQVQLEVIHPSLNVVRFTTPYVHGIFERDGRKLFVSRGIGTIGVPARLGALPEVVSLKLCAT